MLSEKKKSLSYICVCVLFLALQNQTRKNSTSGTLVSLYDTSVNSSSYKLHDLQSCPSVCNVWKPKIPGTGEM